MEQVGTFIVCLGCVKAIADGSGRAVEASQMLHVSVLRQVIDKAVADAVYGAGKFRGLTVPRGRSSQKESGYVIDWVIHWVDYVRLRLKDVISPETVPLAAWRRAVARLRKLMRADSLELHSRGRFTPSGDPDEPQLSLGPVRLPEFSG